MTIAAEASRAKRNPCHSANDESGEKQIDAVGISTSAFDVFSFSFISNSRAQTDIGFISDPGYRFYHRFREWVLESRKIEGENLCAANRVRDRIPKER